MAVFDLDGTIIVGRSIENAFIKYLFKSRKLKTGNILSSVAYYLKKVWKDPVKAIKCNKMYLKGIKIKEVDLWVEEFMREKAKELVSPRLVDLIKYHKDIGHITVLITGDINILVDPLPFNQFFDYVYTAGLETADGIYTGHIKGRHYYGRSKTDLVMQLASKLCADLSQSYCYANSKSDIDLMSVFGYPVAVTPDRHLKKAVLMHKWKVFE